MAEDTLLPFPTDRVFEPESRFTQPTAACPYPERWSSTDQDSTELEVSILVAAFVTALQPNLVVETGTAWGQTAEFIGVALHENSMAPEEGVGHLITCETNPKRAAHCRSALSGLPVTVYTMPSLEILEGPFNEPVGLAWLDSLLELRVPELEAIRPHLAPQAIVGIHDCGDPATAKFKGFSYDVAKAAKRLGFNRISLPTPRGVTFLQAT